MRMMVRDPGSFALVREDISGVLIAHIIFSLVKFDLAWVTVMEIWEDGNILSPIIVLNAQS